MFLKMRQAIANAICPEQRTERRTLERAANVDALTGVANRRAFDMAAPAAYADITTAIVLFDANNFGQLNKRIGHAFGDVALKDIATALTEAARQFKSNRVFRIGGDEFVIICPARSAAAIRDRCEALYGVRFPGIDVSISGAIGENLEAADAQIQERKAHRKCTK